MMYRQGRGCAACTGGSRGWAQARCACAGLRGFGLLSVDFGSSCCASGLILGPLGNSRNRDAFEGAGLCVVGCRELSLDAAPWCAMQGSGLGGYGRNRDAIRGVENMAIAGMGFYGGGRRGVSMSEVPGYGLVGSVVYVLDEAGANVA